MSSLELSRDLRALLAAIDAAYDADRTARERIRVARATPPLPMTRSPSTSRTRREGVPYFKIA